jgi:phospholipase C
VGKELALTQRQIEQIQGVKTVETPLTPAQGQSRALADKAKHLVVLMMEGRSFDHMFGFLKSATYDIEGLSGTESNLDSKGVPIRVTNDAAVQGDFSIDVAHDFGDVNIQLFDVDPVPTGAKPTNQGFVKDYATKVGDAKAGSVMKCMNASKIPNLTMLAKQYAICDHWFASVPGPELPNRAFVHFGTSNAHVDMSPIAYIGLSTIYELLDKSGVTAKIYSLQGNTLAFTFSQIANPRLSRRFVASYADFLDDCNRGTLPAYSFIEPRFNEWRDDITHQFFPANDQHIDNDIREGDRLIGNVYNAIRSSSVWESTILVIVYSQHGGLYDHFPPPSTVSPDGKSDPITGFEFTRLGVRVPAVIVSPYIGAGTIDHTVYDHTSVIATARKLFLGSAAATNFLTQRDRQANTFERLLTLTAPRVDRPSAVRTGQ